MHEINLINIEPDAYDLVLAWWGIPEVREHTTTGSQPKFNELVDAMSARNRKDFFIIFRGRRIGRTVIIDHGEFEEVSIYICEIDMRGKGLGKNAVKETLARCRKPVRARMHNENIASQRLFDRLGFTFFSNDNENIGYSWHYLF